MKVLRLTIFILGVLSPFIAWYVDKGLKIELFPSIWFFWGALTIFSITRSLKDLN